MRLVVLYKYMNCTVDKTAFTGAGHTTYIYYITKYITSILLIICCKPLKIDPSGEISLVSLEQSLFYQMHTLITNLCLLLLNLKMPITIGNWGFIWKYKKYARKSQNDATINHIILKTLTQGE